MEAYRFDPEAVRDRLTELIRETAAKQGFSRVVVGISGYALFTWGVSLVGPVCAGMVATTEPLTAAVLAAVLLHTRFSLPTIAGFVCIILTVFLLSRGGAE